MANQDSFARLYQDSLNDTGSAPDSKMIANKNCNNILKGIE